MKKNENINIDKLFDKARNEKVEFSEAEIRGLVYENSPIINKFNFIKLKGVNKMTLWSGAIATAAIISALTLSFISDMNNEKVANKKPIIATKNNISENVEGANRDDIPEVKDTKIITKKIIISDNDVDIDLDEQEIEMINNNMKTVVLSDEELKELGIKIAHNGEFIEIIMNEKNPQIYTIQVNPNSSLMEFRSLDRHIDKDKINYPLPKMITDNRGSRTIKVFNSEDSRLIINAIKDYTNIKIDIDSLIVDNSWINHDGKLTIDGTSFIFTDRKYCINDSIKLDGLMNISIEVDSLSPQALESISINVDSLPKVVFNSMKIDSSIYELKNKIKMDSSSLKLRKHHKINKDSIILAYRFDNIQTSDDLKITVDSQMRIIKNKVEIFNDKLVNKLIPIEVPIHNAKDKNGKLYKDFKFILWYEPNDKLLDILPSELRAKLQEELNLLENNNESCANVPMTGEDKYLGVWQGCNGALENLRVFPNPTNGPVAVDLNLKEVRNLTITLHDISGRKIKNIQNSTNANVGSWTSKYNLSDVRPGLYLIVVKSERGEQAVQRIVVE